MLELEKKQVQLYLIFVKGAHKEGEEKGGGMGGRERKKLLGLK